MRQIYSNQQPHGLYKHKKALLITWNEGNQKAFKTQSKQLGEELRAYNFEVEHHGLKLGKPYATLSHHLSSLLNLHDQKNTLLIVYYGGHAIRDEDGGNVWVW